VTVARSRRRKRHEVQSSRTHHRPAAGAGILYLVTKGSSSGGGGDNQPRTLKVYEGEQGVWSFAISQGGTVIHEEGPFVSQEAAQTAGDNWLAANPVL
jgi:hypothetical protein